MVSKRYCLFLIFFFETTGQRHQTWKEYSLDGPLIIYVLFCWLEVLKRNKRPKSITNKVFVLNPLLCNHWEVQKKKATKRCQKGVICFSMRSVYFSTNLDGFFSSSPCTLKQYTHIVVLKIGTTPKS